VVTKLLVAIGVVVAFGVLPVLVAGLILTGELGPVTVSHAVGAFAGGTAYAALFLLLAVLSKNAVVIGLIYALIWESLVGGLVPGAQTLSVQQWSLSVVQKVLGDSAARAGVDAAVSPHVGITLLVVVTLAATAYAGRKLQTVRIGESD
jgi:ABC-2 type transport system permease protein